jgi:hypothetical protein
MLRPGQPIALINISSRGALIESAHRLRPGARTELQLAGEGLRESVKGCLDRCFVIAIDPMRYRGVVLFDQRIDPGGEGEIDESRSE